MRLVSLETWHSIGLWQLLPLRPLLGVARHRCVACIGVLLASLAIELLLFGLDSSVDQSLSLTLSRRKCRSLQRFSVFSLLIESFRLLHNKLGILEAHPVVLVSHAAEVHV